MNPRLKKFFSYYKPYLGLFYADMACAIVVSITVLAIPLCIRYITKNLEAQSPVEAIGRIQLSWYGTSHASFIPTLLWTKWGLIMTKKD
jgi:ABC-type multidrug transport system fused ATPase/permease subunit